MESAASASVDEAILAAMMALAPYLAPLAAILASTAPGIQPTRALTAKFLPNVESALKEPMLPIILEIPASRPVSMADSMRTLPRYTARSVPVTTKRPSGSTNWLPM